MSVHNVCYIQFYQELYIKKCFIRINFIIFYNCSGWFLYFRGAVNLLQNRGTVVTFNNRNFKTQPKVSLFTNVTLRNKCPYSEFFWSVFSCIRTEYREIRSIRTLSRSVSENTSVCTRFWFFSLF